MSAYAVSCPHMSERRIVAGRALTAFAALGVLIGHWATYWLAVPNPTLRESILIATGHSYWMSALKVGVVLAVTACVMVGMRAASRDGGYQGRTSDAFVWAALRLAAIQMFAFVALEVAERAAVGDPVSLVFANHLLVVGLATQVVVAVAIAALSVATAQLIRRVITALHRRPASRSVHVHLRPTQQRARLTAGLIAVVTTRGPPPLLSI